MPNKVKLWLRNRWNQDEYRLFDEGEKIETIYQFDFKLTWEDIIPHKLKVNQFLLHTFFEEEASYEFTLSLVRPITFLTLEFEEQQEIQQVSFSISANTQLLPAQDTLDQLQKLYQEWRDNCIVAAETYGTKEIEFADFHTDKSWESLFRQFKNRLGISHKDAIWYYHYRKEITSHLQQILRKPKVRLETEELLVNAAELNLITPKTVQHFMKDTTTWAKSTVNRPVPQKLLKEINEESIDVHENRFVFTFAYRLEIEIRRTLKELRNHLNTIDLKMKSNTIQVELDILKVEAELENIDLESYQVLFDDLYKQLKTLHGLVRQVVKSFKGLRKLNGYIAPNQVLLYNKDYRTLFKYYNEHMKKGDQKEQKLHDCIDFQTYYADEVFINTIAYLLEMNYTPTQPIKLRMNNHLEDYIFTRDKMTVSFTNNQGIEITVVRKQFANFEESKFEIVLTVRRIDTNEKVSVKLIPTLVQFQQQVSDEQIKALYQYTTEDSDATFIVYPSTKEDYDKKMPYEQLHQVLTLGMNFIESDMFQQYGTMKYGVFPFSQSDFSKNVFKRLIRLQLFKLNVRSYCFICGEIGDVLKEGNGEEEYICSNYECRCEWGVRLCNCGTPIYKMQKKSAKDGEILSAEKQDEFMKKSDLDWIFDQENKNASMALANLCENAHLGNSFFAICPNCGDCKHESKQGRICKRCDAKQRCSSKLEDIYA
ncbi:TPA: DUF2357 domain-containing protein [Yersinia enterocolitica]|nr:DUF2357 domain-containing protein [Yersinia enterocolitica]